MFYAGTTCGENGSVRLVDGAHEKEGRLEICVNGVWGTVCNDGLTENDGFDIDAARVVCRQLGISEEGEFTSMQPSNLVPLLHLSYWCLYRVL